MSITLFTDAFLIDGTGGDPIDGAYLVVEDGRIREISHGTAPRLTANAEIVNCKGMTLMPGLIDAHIHTTLVEANLVEQRRINYPSTVVLKGANILKDTLHQGFTTCRDAGGADAGFRIAVEQGIIEGPRLQVAGPSIAQTGGHADMRLPNEFFEHRPEDAGFTAFICDGVPEVRKAAREALRRGADFLKIMASGGCASASDEIADTSQFSAEEMEAIVFEAESAGTYVAAHCYTNRGAKLCAESGIRTIEHGNCITRETATLLKEKGCIIVPTLSTYELAVTKGDEFGLPGFFKRKMKHVRETALEAVAIAHDLGIVIGSGSDVIGPFQKWKGLELELKSRVLGEMGAIVSATRTNAQIMGLYDVLGSLEEGKYADLIVLDGNPLEDITLFQRHTKSMPIIMQNGKFIKKLA